MLMVTFLATSAPALVSPGLDLERSFSEALESFGLSEQAARLIWLPLPMLLFFFPRRASPQEFRNRNGHCSFFHAQGRLLCILRESWA